MRLCKGISLLLMCVVIVVGCGNNSKTLPDFVDSDLDNVTKLVIVDGSSGFKKVVSNNKTIEGFLSEIDKVTFIPEENQQSRSGFRYSIFLFHKEQEPFSFSLRQVNGKYYYTEPDLYPIVDEFYKGLDVQEE